MKRKQLSALLLALSLLLSGCASDDPVPDEKPTAETTVSPAAVMAKSVPTSVSKPPKTDSPAENFSALDDIPYGKLLRAELVAEDAVREILWIPETLEYCDIRYISTHELHVADLEVETRFSTRETGESALSDAAKAESWDNALDSDAVYSVLRVGKFENGKLPVKSAAVTYTVSFEEPRVFRGFVRIAALTDVEIILDPADLREIPLLSRREEDLTFTVNGETMVADTISFSVGYEGDAEEFKKLVGVENRDYVYAEFRMNELRISYDTESGYRNEAGSVSDFKILTTDTAAVIRGDRIFGRETDSPKAEALYSSLMNGFDQFYDEKVVGIVLLDMDFDGEPELLVSKRTKGGENRDCIDVSVYRLRNGEITLLDTINGITNNAFGSSGSSAVLGLRTLENGEKAWFAMTGEYKTDEKKGGCLETGKLLTLENGEIHEEEVFSLWQEMDQLYVPRIYFGETPAEIVEEGSIQKLQTPWGDFSGIYQSYMYYDLKNAYCESVEQSVYLLSDWLVPTGRQRNGFPFVNLAAHFSPSPRDTANAVAFLVDSYCFGDYSADFGGYVYNFREAPAMKPVIYLYPEEKTEVSVSVDFPNGGGLTCTYPEYGEGWRVTALPDGTLTDESGNEYYCLYWEGAGLPLSDPGEGWCVPGEDTAGFLREKLLEIGLTAREANEMIIYWLPILQKNPYNLISFHFEDYDRAAPLTVSPQPDTMIRVFMTYTPLAEPTEPVPQNLPRYERKGFTLVEWGGGELIG